MTAGRSDLVDIAGEVRGETDNAWRFFDGTRTVWLPKSQVEVSSDGTVTMPEWLAQEKELI
jgi:mannose-6-phosphate isomerase-like protein (cupin superfamily)